MPQTPVILASGNAGKLREFASLLAETPLQIKPQSAFNVSEAEETGLTFVENALIKARHACESTGFASIADDSGLEVDALRGAPGIYSARYAGLPSDDQRNNAALLEALKHTPEEQRSARYHCVLVFMRHSADPTPLICQARWEGRILHHPRGQGGFGYDPLFFVPELDCSVAELHADDKKKYSHRGKAMQLLLQHLQQAPQPFYAASPLHEASP